VIPYVADSDFRLFQGDAAEVLGELADGSVDCCVTSPPYADARRDVAAVSPEAFPTWLAATLAELPRVLRAEGSLLLNLGRRFRAGEELPYIELTLEVLRSEGWRRIDTVLWYKPNANGRGGPYMRDCHEFAFWLARDPELAYRGLDEARRPYRDPGRYDRTFTTSAKGEPRIGHRRTPHPLGARPDSVFVASVGHEKGRRHPTPMAEALALHLVKLGSPPGGVVLDPFAGEGTTCWAARKTGRSSIGIEIDPGYCEMAAERTQQLSLGAEHVTANRSPKPEPVNRREAP
jgi:DNA modification methylase